MTDEEQRELLEMMTLEESLKVVGTPAPTDGKCEYCGETEGVKWEDSRTCYDTTPLEGFPPTRFERILMRDDPPPDPNRPRLLCRDCAEEHHAFWDAQWEEFYRSRW